MVFCDASSSPYYIVLEKLAVSLMHFATYFVEPLSVKGADVYKIKKKIENIFEKIIYMAYILNNVEL